MVMYATAYMLLSLTFDLVDELMHEVDEMLQGGGSADLSQPVDDISAITPGDVASITVFDI